MVGNNWDTGINVKQCCILFISLNHFQSTSKFLPGISHGLQQNQKSCKTGAIFVRSSVNGFLHPGWYLNGPEQEIFKTARLLQEIFEVKNIYLDCLYT